MSKTHAELKLIDVAFADRFRGQLRDTSSHGWIAHEVREEIVQAAVRALHESLWVAQLEKRLENDSIVFANKPGSVIAEELQVLARTMGETLLKGGHFRWEHIHNKGDFFSVLRLVAVCWWHQG